MIDQTTTYDLCASGATSRSPLLGLACLLFMLVAVFGPGPISGEGPPAHGPKLLGGLAADFDTDQDGTVSREEFDRGADALFVELDQNGDGALSGDELPRFRGPRHGRGPGREAMAGMIVARAADSDLDFEVTGEEWRSFLEALEIGADGAISEESLRALLPKPPGMREAPEGARGSHTGRLSRLLDHDGDSLLETEDLEAIFSELDQDGDGVLMAEELPRFRGHRGPPHR